MPGPSSRTSKRTRAVGGGAAQVGRRAPCGRVADGVGEQVGEDELHAIAVDLELRQRRRHVGGELDVPLGGERRLRVDGLVDQRARRDAAAAQLHAAALDLGQVEQLVDDALQPLAVVARGVEQVALLVGERADAAARGRGGWPCAAT